MLKLNHRFKWQKILRLSVSGILVIFLHLCAIVVFLRFSANDQRAETTQAKSIRIINIELPKPIAQKIENIDLTFVDTPQAQNIPLPRVEVPEFYIRDGSEVNPITNPPLSPPASVNEAVIFHPRLRQQLSTEKPPDQAQIPDSWTDSANVQWVKLRDGRCLKAMQVHNSRSDERTWANKPCGKDSSEEMTDNVRKALQARQIR